MRPKQIKSDSNILWDVIVIGGGAAGMMAAGTAAQRGLKVLILEKNKVLGAKLLISGGGRCNVFNGEVDNKILLGYFGAASKYLHSPFSKFSSKDSFNFFDSLGMPVIKEDLKRIFPKTQKSQSVIDALAKNMKNGSVTVKLDSSIESIFSKNQTITRVALINGDEYKAKSFILASGGLSRPDTGSTGDGFKWLSEFGHDIELSAPALVPIRIGQKWARALSGLPLEGVGIKVYKDNLLVQKKTGKILFTHFGLSGPAILTLSKTIGESLEYAKVSIALDLFPKLQIDELDKKIVELCSFSSRKKLKNVLGEIVPSRMVSEILKISKIDDEIFCHSLTRDDRGVLSRTLKHLELTVTGLMGLEKAVISSGGLKLKELDTKTMRSKIMNNLFVVGDLLDIDRPTGGYSLQLCWTTGFVAGSNA